MAFIIILTGEYAHDNNNALTCNATKSPLSRHWLHSQDARKAESFLAEKMT